MQTTLTWYSPKQKLPKPGTRIHGVIFISNRSVQIELIFDERCDWFMQYEGSCDLVEENATIIAWAEFSDVSNIINHLESTHV